MPFLILHMSFYLQQARFTFTYMEYITTDILFYMTAELESIYGVAYTELLAKAKSFLTWFTVIDQARKKMEAKLKDANVMQEAERFAKLSVWEIYQPIVNGVSPECTLEVEFKE